MQQGQKQPKKWVDYSDESEEQPDSDDEKGHSSKQGTSTHSNHVNGGSTSKAIDHRSPEFIQGQLRRLEEAKIRSQQVWVLLECEQQNVLDKKVRELKEQGNKDIINIYMNKQVQGTWDLKVNVELVKVWINDSIDHHKKIKITVSDRNFRGGNRNGQRGEGRGRGRGNRDRGDRGDRGERGDRRGGRGRGRGGRQEGGERGGRRDRGDRRDRNQNGEKQKKVYIDKATGKAPCNKQEVQKQILQQKSRHYTKTEAQNVGLSLGNFRNKSKVEETEAPKPQPRHIEVKKMEYKEIEPRAHQEKKPKQLWSRKQKQERKEQSKDEVPVEKKEFKEHKEYKEYKPKTEYREKDAKEGNNQIKEGEKKKKTYVRVDQLPEEEKKIYKPKKQEVTEIPNKKGDLLSEDSD